MRLDFSKKSLQTVPNALSLLRLLLIAPFLVCYFLDQLVAAAILFGIAAITDLFDGLAARILSQRTEVGAVLDPVADKLLGLAALGALITHRRLPLWLLVFSLTRDLVVLYIATVSSARSVAVPFSPLGSSKTATFFLSATVIVALVQEVRDASPFTDLVRILAVFSSIFLGFASIQYAWRYRVLRNESQ
jgi:cardiolipin synthase